MEWYYVESGAQHGPVGDTEFRELQDQNAITPATLVWRAGMAEWQPLARVQGNGNPAAAAQDGLATCVECGAQFPQDEMIAFRGSWVCAACKPRFFQRLQEGATLPGTINYGGFWIRFCAQIIDNLILGVVNALISVLFLFAAPLLLGNQDTAFFVYMVVANLLGLALSGSYETWFVGRFRATPGKMAMGLQVLRSNGDPLSYPRALGRWAGKIVSGLILYVGYIMIGFDDEKRGLHDRICDTRVVKVARP